MRQLLRQGDAQVRQLLCQGDAQVRQLLHRLSPDADSMPPLRPAFCAYVPYSTAYAADIIPLMRRGASRRCVNNMVQPHRQRDSPLPLSADWKADVLAHVPAHVPAKGRPNSPWDSRTHPMSPSRRMHGRVYMSEPNFEPRLG